jgi:hypothetical protein
MDVDEPLVDDRVVAYAQKHNLNPYRLDWHLEAGHGWERHDRGYEEAIPDAANCTDQTCMTSYPESIEKYPLD